MTDRSGLSYISPSSDKRKCSTIKNRLRILCLHGYGQNADSSKSDLEALCEHANKCAEFVFIDGVHRAKPMDGCAEPQQDQLSWWFNRDKTSFVPGFGFDESLNFVENAWKVKGPFQGLLGFSQGACFAGIICGMAQKKLTCIEPKFAILSSGFLSDSSLHKSVYDELITIPTLHVYGLSDEIIPKEMSQALAHHFKNATILEHNGGHYFPVTLQEKQTCSNFIRARLEEYLQNLLLQHTFTEKREDKGEGESDMQIIFD